MPGLALREIIGLVEEAKDCSSVQHVPPGDAHGLWSTGIVSRWPSTCPVLVISP